LKDPCVNFQVDIQFVVPSMALEVIDRAMQSFGAEGISQDTELAYHWAQLRTLRIADVCNKGAIGISADASA
jgi:hypothetical protein